MISNIDISKLAVPEFVQQLSYAEIRDTMLQALNDKCRETDTDHADFLVSDPAYKLIETAAYRELLLRQQLNDQCKSLFLPWATEANLEYIAATYYRTTRRIVQAEDLSASPPLPQILETDDELRNRLLLAPEAWSTAGTEGGYLYHTLAGDAVVKGVDVVASNNKTVVTYYTTPDTATGIASAGVSSTTAGVVTVAILAVTSDDNPQGTATPPQIDAVRDKLTSPSIKPMTDSVIVQPAEVIEYTIHATISRHKTSTTAANLDTATQAIQAMANGNFKVGKDITIGEIYAALQQPGLHVALTEPSADIAISKRQAAFCTAINIVDGGVVDE